MYCVLCESVVLHGKRGIACSAGVISNQGAGNSQAMLNQQKSPLVTNQAQLLSSPTQIRFQNQAGFNQILQPGAAAAAMSMNQFQVSINRFGFGESPVLDSVFRLALPHVC